MAMKDRVFRPKNALEKNYLNLFVTMRQGYLIMWCSFKNFIHARSSFLTKIHKSGIDKLVYWWHVSIKISFREYANPVVPPLRKPKAFVCVSEAMYV